MTQEERLKRVWARGESSGHAHVLVGDCEQGTDGFWTVGPSGAIMYHCMEAPWVERGEIVECKSIDSTDGHHKCDVLKPGDRIRFSPQLEWSPFDDMIFISND